MDVFFLSPTPLNMERSYISDSSDFEPFSSDSEGELDTSMIMKNDEEGSNNDEIAMRDIEVNFVTTEKDKIANSSGKVDLVMAMSNAEREEDKTLVNEEDRYVDEVGKTVNTEKDTVNGDTVSIEENCLKDESNDVSAEVLIFSKTLVDRLNLQKVKGKTKMKWSGTLIELQDFVTLILNEKGKWQSKTNAGVVSYVFTQKDSKLRINWWTSTGTFNVQGETKICNKIIKKITQLLESKAEQKDNIESLRNPSSEVEETQEENKVDEKVKDRKPRRGRPPKRPAPKTPLNEPDKENPLDELRKMFDSEVKKLWEAFHSITKQINQPPKFNNEEDFQDIPNVSTSNRFKQLSKSKETKLSDQKMTKTVSVNSKDNGQLKIQALEKKLHELEHQLQVKETVIKNLASTNEHLTLEII